MRIVKLTDIQIPPARQRQLNLKRDIKELSWSIENLGNLQRPGVWSAKPEDPPTLVWGERRYLAILRLANEGKGYRLADGTQIPCGSIAVDSVEDTLSTLDRAEREFDENVQRVELAWPDRVRALALIHNSRKESNPKLSVHSTALELSARTGISVSTLERSVNSPTASSIPTALILNDHLSDPEVQRATTVANAIAIVTRKREEAATAALIARRTARGAMTIDLVTMKHGDVRTLIKEIAANTVDLVLVDPPYGINADEANFSRKQAQKHTYSDDPSASRELMQFLLLEGFRVSRERANLFMFFHSTHLNWLYNAAARAGWSPFPTPIIWDKTSPGLGPWQNNGFGRSYELIFYATKGRRGLHATRRDILTHKRVPEPNRRHAAQKPHSLLCELIEISTPPGELVLDPCAGTGSTLLAARTLKRRAIGFEQDRATYDAAMTHLFSTNQEKSNA